MPTTTINADARVVSIINVFETTPDKQDELIRELEQATLDVMRHLPGFVSANIHKSLDGRHVANYAQWESADDFERMLQDPEAQQHMQRIDGLGKAAPVLYKVCSVHR
jgi:quinol monooxygenase YgiN